MQVSRDLIARRLRSAEANMGGVVAVASWCAIHMYAADDIVSEWSLLLTSEETQATTRIALLYVIHELLLACQHSTCPASSRSALVTALGRSCPHTFAAALKVADPDAEFATKLATVLGWWSSMRLFPAAWTMELQKLVDGSGTTQPGSAGDAANMRISAELNQVVRLHAKYKAAKERYERALATSVKAAPGTESPVQQAREELARRIRALIKAIDGRVFPGADPVDLSDAPSTQPPLLAQLNAEMAALDGCPAPAPAAKGPDLLGSFFDF